MKKFLLFVLLLPVVASASVEIDGLYYNLDSNTKKAIVTKIPNANYAGNVVIPSTVTFDETVYNVTGIEDKTFYRCGITSVTIGDNITSIDEDAFYHCTSLGRVIIGNSVTNIGRHAFYECYNLKSITFSNSVARIGDAAFGGGNSLNAVYISDLKVWCNISFGDNPLQYAHHLYLNGEEITGDLEIPDNVTTLGPAFWGCYGLTSVTIGDNVTSIGGSAFRNCYNLTSVTIGKNVTSINSWAFLNCNNLTSVVVDIETPLSISSETFPNQTNATLYVPYGCKAAYEAADYWSDFKEIVEMPPTEVDITIGSAGIATYCSEFDLDFTGTDVKAYIVSAFSPNTGKVILTRIYDVPANTGIVVIGDAGDHQIPIVEAQTIVSNMLVGVTEATELNKVDGDYTNYVFAQKNGELGFYAVTDGSTLGAHKAYLPLPTAKLPSANSRVAYMFDGDDATEIQNIGQEDNFQHSIYNLNGQRQKGLKKGLNIVDGKKMLVK